MGETNPLLTLALLVFGGAIAAFFSQELLGIIKKFFSIPGMKIAAPLVFASWLVEYYEAWWFWLLQWMHKIVAYEVEKIETSLPFKTASLLIARTVCLFFVASFPLFIFHLMIKQRKAGHQGLVAYRVAFVCWVLMVVVIAAMA